MAVVVAAVAGDFRADEVGLLEGVVFAFQFYFCHNQAFVLTLEDINFPGVSAVTGGDEPTGLLHYAGLADGHEGLRLVQRDFLLPLKTRQACSVAGAFDGKITFVAPNADTYGATIARGDIALGDVGGTGGEGTEIANDEKLSFDFGEVHGLNRLNGANGANGHSPLRG